MDLNKLRELVNEALASPDSTEKKSSGGKMARTDLVTIAKDAQELVNMFGDETELPDWVESKLTKAADYLNSVKKYIGGEIVRQQGGLMEAGFYRNPDARGQGGQDIDSGIGKSVHGNMGEPHNKMVKAAKNQKELSKQFLAKDPGGKSPRARKMLINKYKKMGLKDIPPFDVRENELSNLTEGPDLSVLLPKFASVATRAMNSAGPGPMGGETILGDLIPDENDRMAFLDYIHDQITQELKDTLNTSMQKSDSGLREVYLYLEDATYDDGTPVEEDVEFWDDVVVEAEYQGRKVKLNKPMKGDVKKSKVYVKNEKGNVIKVNFGDPNMKIKKSNPKRRKSFRARHNCKTPGPKTKARYWSCRAW